MYKDAAVDAALLGQRIVAEAAPDLRKSLATREALRRDGHGLDAPLVRRLVHVEDVDRLLGLRDSELRFKLEEMFLNERKAVSTPHRIRERQ